MIKENSITILGGSFNPIHNGHLEMAITAHNEYNLDNIIFIPNKSTYYKDNDVFAGDDDRLEMVRLATEEYPFMSYSDMEIRRGGITHTIDTIRAFKETDPDKKIYFIIGGDSLEWIEKWVEGDELLRLVAFLTAVRGKTDMRRSKEIIRDIYSRHDNAEILMLSMKDYPVSSSEIRKRIGNGEDITGLVPEKVADYITNHNLYRRP